MENFKHNPTDTELETIKRLVDKSIQSFHLAIELYNRPTLPNRVEACSMMLANAWELLLKAYLIRTKGESGIFYKDKPNRSLALSDCINRVMDNEKDPVRRNIRELAQLRNDSTHFIVDEYEIIYGPILQANVENYVSKLEELHNFSITSILPKRSLILPIAGDPLDEEAITKKYDEKTAEKFFKNYQRINQYIEEDTSKAKFAHFYRVEVEIVKKAEEANIKVAFSNDAEINGTVLNRTRDPRATHPHRMTECLKILNTRLLREGIRLQSKGKPVEKFNRSHWDNFVKAYNIKEDPSKAYNRASPNEGNTSYIYSDKAINFVFELLKHDPANALDAAREKVQQGER